MRSNHFKQVFWALFWIVSFNVQAIESLSKVPYPTENPPSEAKRILGKILFWDEQLSSDNSIACGTCHIPSANGTDPRVGLAPGFDKLIGTQDDVLGSLGVVFRDALGQPVEHPVYQYERQVTDRTSQSFFLGSWASENFWDGRANGEFIDPDTDTILIRSGGSLENQALGPLMSSVEMAKAGQTAFEVTEKLRQSRPMALATHLPDDMAAMLRKEGSYPRLFERAFGDASITLARIAFAIATYERSLVADQTPWDFANASGQPLPYLENLGWEFFQQSGCADCHVPPLFSDNKFYNIGIQGRNTDMGRKGVTSREQDLGAMKVPSLRNIGLKNTFMHSGQFTSLEQVIDAYADVPFEDVASPLPNGEKYNFQFTEYQRKALIAFLTRSLTDEKIKHQNFPFDRPNLRSEIPIQETPLILQNPSIAINSNRQVEITWDDCQSQNIGCDVEIIRNDGRHYWAAKSPFVDIFTEAGEDYLYTLKVRNAQLASSQSIQLNIQTKGNNSLVYILLGCMGMVFVWFGVRKKFWSR